MKLEVRGETLAIGEVRELGAGNCQWFRDQVYAALPENLKNIEVDLSQTRFLDSCGLGALISLQKTATRRNGMVRLLNPTPRVQLLFDVTRMQRIFEIVTNEAAALPGSPPVPSVPLSAPRKDLAISGPQ